MDREQLLINRLFNNWTPEAQRRQIPLGATILCYQPWLSPSEKATQPQRVFNIRSCLGGGGGCHEGDIHYGKRVLEVDGTARKSAFAI